MKHILHITNKYYYPFRGGAEQIAKECVHALKENYEQRIIAFNHEKGDRQDSVEGVTVYRCNCFVKIASQPLSLSYGRIIHQAINNFKPDVIIFHYPNPFAAFYLLKETKRNEKIKVIVYWHLDITKQKFLRIFFRNQNRKLLKRANTVICTSPNYIEGSEWLQSVKGKCIVVPNCINKERMRLTPEIEKRADEIRKENAGKTICVAVGRHTQYKGITYLIQAGKLLNDTFRFFIVGSGTETKKLLKEASEDAKFTFTGSIEDEELKAYILAADIFCFPSITKNEAFGLALAEAMYYEKPAATFTIPGSGVNYVCVDGENGIEVENRNVKAYARAIEMLSKDGELRRKYGQAGKKRVEENFLSDRFYENIRNVVEHSGGA